MILNELEPLLALQPNYKIAGQYYNGCVPETFATAKLRSLFRATGGQATLNFCRPVVNAVANRLEIANVSAATKGATVKIASMLTPSLHLEIADANTAALIYGDAYVIVWPSAAGGVDISYNTPLNVFIQYDADRNKLYAVKAWTGICQVN